MAISTSPKTERMPVIFIPHGGGPCFFMDWNPKDEWDKMAHYLKNIAGGLPTQPKAIVMVSAHWIQSEVTVTSANHPEMIFDYYGFPAHTYELRYPSPGEPELAQKLVRLLKAAGIHARTDDQRGYDHGMFIPLLLMFPEANIPVIQMSLTQTLNSAEHIAIGQALESLRDEGVLIIGSGKMSHIISDVYKSRQVSVVGVDLIRAKPFPYTLGMLLEECGGVIVVDEQTPCGSLGAAVLEEMAKENLLNKKVKVITLPEEYLFENGGREYLLKKHGLSADNIEKVLNDNF